MFDTFPGFWDWLIIQNRKGMIYSVQAVDGELKKGKDDLTDWATKRGDAFFLPPNESTADALKTVTDTVYDMDYKEFAVSAFLNSADYYVVAEAYAKKYMVVAREVRSDGKNKIKIPNVCDKLRISCMGPFEMIKTEKPRFILN